MIHLGRCPKILQVFEKFWFLMKVQEKLDPTNVLFGPPSLKKGALAFHVIVWKFVLIHFTRVDTCNEIFIPDEVWKASVRRLISRVERKKASVRMMRMLFIDSRSSLLPGISSHNEEVSGLGEFDELGSFRWTDSLYNEITKLELMKYLSKDSS